jgi:hypothetical protein
VGNSHTDYTICATVPPHCGHIVCTLVGIKSASCSHSFAHWFAQFQHTVRTLRGGVQGISLADIYRCDSGDKYSRSLCFQRRCPMITGGIQFVHIAVYSLHPPKKTSRGADRKWAVRDVIAEASREPQACLHVPRPRPPILLHGPASPSWKPRLAPSMRAA